MKFLLFALAVIGVAQAASIQPKSIQEALDFIRGSVPTDKVIEIIQGCADDPEVQAISLYLRKELPAVVEVIRNDAEIASFFAELNAAGVTFDWLNHLFGLWGIDPIEFDSFGAPKSCGGWRGVYEQVQEVVSFADIVVTISQAYDAYDEFKDVWDRIAAAEPTFQRLLAKPAVAAVFVRLEDLGMDLQVVRDACNGLFGWSF